MEFEQNQSVSSARLKSSGQKRGFSGINNFPNAKGLGFTITNPIYADLIDRGLTNDIAKMVLHRFYAFGLSPEFTI